MLARPVSVWAHQGSHYVSSSLGLSLVQLAGPIPTLAAAKYLVVNRYGRRRSVARLAHSLNSAVLRQSSTSTRTMMVTLRRQHSTQSSSKGKEPERLGTQAASSNHDPHHKHEHSISGHSHTHSHSIFGLGHTHSPGEDDGHGKDAEKIVEALKGGGDRGSRITVIGLVSNVGLTAVKGAAGWYMNSAALLAEAGHSLSDLIGDFVTLFCWKLSRTPPTEKYPYGYHKFEVLGTTTVSLILTGGALLLGLHSWNLLMEALSHTLTEVPSGPLHDILVNVTEIGQKVPAISTEHTHEHTLDPNAAWFAAISVVAKEWLYRVTKKVADEEASPVLAANALHHRSDVYSSGVALVAILGTWYFPRLALDPIGGLLVSFLIIKQGWGLVLTSFRQLTDAGVSPKTRESLHDALKPLLPAPPLSSSSPDPPSQTQRESHTENLLNIRDLRAMRAGASMFVDLVAEVPKSITVEQMGFLEARIDEVLKKEKKEIKEVRVKFRPVPRDPLA